MCGIHATQIETIGPRDCRAPLHSARNDVHFSDVVDFPVIARSEATWQSLARDENENEQKLNKRIAYFRFLIKNVSEVR